MGALPLHQEEASKQQPKSKGGGTQTAHELTELRKQKLELQELQQADYWRPGGKL